MKQNGGSWQLYYIVRDLQGSITGILDNSGNRMATYSYDPWGRMRNPSTLVCYNVGSEPALLLNRGYTGHEHLAIFGIINMNGRLYDPVLGRFLNVDNFVQDPGDSQNYNRYSYCLNNPLIYTDKNGNFFIIDSWLIGLFSGGWKEANRRASNDIKIWGGLFISDPNKNSVGRFWEVISRFTWQLPQTIGGWSTAEAYNTLSLKGGVQSVKYKYGATVVTTREDWTAVTQGSFIVGGNSLKADANNSIFQNEYGHYLQSQSMGLAYYPRVGMPSLRSEHGHYTRNYPSHDFHPVEQDANRRAFLYFNEHVAGFKDDISKSDDKGWNFFVNPLDVNRTGQRYTYIDYNNIHDIQLLNNLIVTAKWYDYFSWYFGLKGSIVVGLINAHIYNN